MMMQAVEDVTMPVLPMHQREVDQAAISPCGDSKGSQRTKLTIYCTVAIALGVIVGVMGSLAHDASGVDADTSRRLFGQPIPMPAGIHAGSPISPMTPVVPAHSFPVAVGEFQKLRKEAGEMKMELEYLRSEMQAVEENTIKGQAESLNSN
jgi:hypothetical protein